MRRIRRVPLSVSALRSLARDRASIARAADPKARANAIWLRGRAALEEARVCLRDTMASAQRCMYCEANEGTDIEHFWPRSRFPCGTVEWENLLWACSACNSNHKRERFPFDEDGLPLLLDPTAPGFDPLDHLQLAPRTGEYVPLTPQGRASREGFGLGRRLLVQDRSAAFRGLVSTLVRWSEFLRAGRLLDAAWLAERLPREPHASVLRDFVRLADEGDWQGLASDLRAAGEDGFAEELTAAVAVLQARRPTLDAWCAGL